MNFAIISACDQNYGIGKANQLPWRLPSELAYFQKITTPHTVIMGKNTWFSLPASSQPLANRTNIVLSSESPSALNLPPQVLAASSLDQALQLAPSDKKIFIIGGGSLYSQAIKSPHCQEIYLTKIFATFDCDVFFPSQDLLAHFTQQTASELFSENGLSFQFLHFTKNPS